MEPIYPMLWFDGQAEEAASFYVSIFPDSRIVQVSRYGEAGPGVAGSVMLVDFELMGRRIAALNGGPEFRFSEAVSLVVPCASQAEVDEYWDKLVEGGEPSYCGWLKDRFGFSWQVVPVELDRMMLDPDPEKARRVTEAMLKVQGKLDLASLRAAFEGA
ncbi:MAG: VOC family protein [Chloroflexi bacterium]|nr:VOC family protein [Chloroflexota bacterium]